MTAEVSREVVRAPMPELITGLQHTTSSAVHNLRFVGGIAPWDTFEKEVLEHFEATAWNRHRQVLTHRAATGPSSASIAIEQFHCGDEVGVQSRFNQNVGQVMSAVSKAMNVDMVFGDYKAGTGSAMKKVPDTACMRRTNGQIRMVGELKTPWVGEHKLEEAMVGEGGRLKRILGQIARYMRLAQVRYGFLSTYEETIFLKQEYHQNEGWTLHYSEVFRYSASQGQRYSHASVRQCVWYLMHLADIGGVVQNNTPMGQWVRNDT